MARRIRIEVENNVMTNRLGEVRIEVTSYDDEFLER
jgi:hypothetical protein